MPRVKPLLVVLALGLAGAHHLPAAEEGDAGSAEPAVEPAWAGEVGLSYLATTGNAESETLGLDLLMARQPRPWGVEFRLQANNAEQDAETTAERYYAGVRATRSLAERWDAFTGLSAEQDEFSGFDLRGIVEAGATYKALLGPRHTLAFDFALTWTDEERVPPAIDESWLGALLGLDYMFAIGDNATFGQTLAYHPNFDQSSDWRLESITALTATVNGRLAVRLSQEFRYRNLPIDGKDDTDGTTKASLVLSL